MLPGLHSSGAVLVVAGTFQLEPVGRQMSNVLCSLQAGKGLLLHSLWAAHSSQSWESWGLLGLRTQRSRAAVPVLR